MKKLHVHIAVRDLEESVRFYSALFATGPSVLKSDYAKWKLDNPQVNFAISHRSAVPGLDHLGIQVESEGELAEMNNRLESASLPVASQIGQTCCYVESNKHWTTDPQGIAWESFHSLNDTPTFNGADDAANDDQESACCVGESCGTQQVQAEKSQPCCA